MTAVQPWSRDRHAPEMLFERWSPLDGIPRAHEHEYRFVRIREADPEARETWGDKMCLRRAVFMCYCGAQVDADCNSRNASVCAYCEARYRSRVRTIARLPLLSAPAGSAILLTLTAPGAKRHCLTHTYVSDDGVRRPSVRCFATSPGESWLDAERMEGRTPECQECPCSENSLPTPSAIAHWNMGTSRRFNDTMTALRRSLPGWASAQYFRALETQKRGALHVHAIIRFPHKFLMTPEHLTELKLILMRLGWGHEVDIQVLGQGSIDAVKASRYVAKYVSKTASSAAPLTPLEAACDCQFSDHHATSRGGFVDVQPDPVHPQDLEPDVPLPCGHYPEPRRFTGRLWTTSYGWGLSMRVVVAQQVLHETRGPDAAADYIGEHLGRYALAPPQ